ncbi:hypothetical protein BZA70DRAFT_305514, partial [Myxozyma melibiosi]
CLLRIEYPDEDADGARLDLSLASQSIWRRCARAVKGRCHKCAAAMQICSHMVLDRRLLTESNQIRCKIIRQRCPVNLFLPLLAVEPRIISRPVLPTLSRYGQKRFTCWLCTIYSRRLSLSLSRYEVKRAARIAYTLSTASRSRLDDWGGFGSDRMIRSVELIDGSMIRQSAISNQHRRRRECTCVGSDSVYKTTRHSVLSIMFVEEVLVVEGVECKGNWMEAGSVCASTEADDNTDRAQSITAQQHTTFTTFTTILDSARFMFFCARDLKKYIDVLFNPHDCIYPTTPTISSC